MKVFRLDYINAEEVEVVAKSLASPQGKVSIHAPSNTIVINDTPEAIARITKVLSSMDVKPVNFHIEVEFAERKAVEEVLAGLTWRLAGNGWSAGSIPAPFHGGNIGVNALLSKSQLAQSKRQSLVVMENRPGYIFTGSEYPYTDYTLHLDRNRAWITENTQFKKAGESFKVTAARAGKGRLKVFIEPETSHMEKETGAMNVNRASTQIITDDPGTIILSRTDLGSEEGGVNFPLGGRKSVIKEDHLIILSIKTMTE